MADDYYKILGVDKGASDEEIKKSYRKLAHQHHPDKKSGDEQKFKKIGEAYRVLSDKQKRAQYDQFGQTFDGAGPGGGFSGFNTAGFDFSGFQGGDFGDIFEQFFGGRTQTREKQQPKGENLQINVSLTLEQAYSGIEKELNFKTFVICNLCKGEGHEKGVKLDKCKECDGSGEVRKTKSSFFGSFSQISVCQQCHGKGEIPKEHCKECKGVGRKLESKEVKVEIHKGVEDGQMIKIAGAGEAGVYGGKAGDLFVRVGVEEHDTLERKGPHLLIKKDVKAKDFIDKKEIELETISGEKKKVSMPKEITFGEPIRLAGEGMPVFGRNGYGDLFVKVNIVR